MNRAAEHAAILAAVEFRTAVGAALKCAFDLRQRHLVGLAFVSFHQRRRTDHAPSESSRPPFRRFSVFATSLLFLTYQQPLSGYS
jgi:hypothetical protein